ncbi:MAG: hypothetical protein MPN21_24480 [Thermoanaerobaculia bacterium]|nr:hypothetical protein [Thermoanaerobaculia bacterium]
MTRTADRTGMLPRTILIGLLLLGCTTLAAVAQDGLEVSISGADFIDCTGTGFDSEEPLPDLCFGAAATSELRIDIESADPSVLARISLQVRGDKHSSSVFHTFSEPGEETTWSNALPLPRAESGAEPSPDAPLATPKKNPFDLTARRPSTGAYRPGNYVIEVEAGPQESPRKALIGLVISGSSSLSQWAVADGRARILLSGCWRRELDPVLELVLTHCDDPQYQVKAATVTPHEGMTLDSYVNNSLQAYAKIWRMRSRRTDMGPPKIIELDLDQILASKVNGLWKHFIDFEEVFLIITFYGPQQDEPGALRARFGDRDDWLLIRSP